MNTFPISSLHGIALDIDDTLADTKHFFIQRLQDQFGNPEGLEVEQIIQKYQIVPNISYWQTPEIKTWLDTQGSDNEVQKTVTVMSGAQAAIEYINTVVPVRMYITSRPSTVVHGTTAWLNAHNFPQAEVITRPLSKIKIDGNAWKAEILKEKYPEIDCLIDDNPEILHALGPDYKGLVIMIGLEKSVIEMLKKGSTMPQNTVFCSNWKEIIELFKA